MKSARLAANKSKCSGRKYERQPVWNTALLCLDSSTQHGNMRTVHLAFKTWKYNKHLDAVNRGWKISQLELGETITYYHLKFQGPGLRCGTRRELIRSRAARARYHFPTLGKAWAVLYVVSVLPSVSLLQFPGKYFPLTYHGKIIPHPPFSFINKYS